MKKKKYNGFTLIEMLITLAILAVFVALALSLTRTSVERAGFTSAVNQFVSDFYAARQLAARENKYVAIVFAGSGTSYTVRILSSMVANPEDVNNYISLKTVEPMGGELFFDPADATSFAFDSTGVVRAYPVDRDAAPISFTLTFFRKSVSAGEADFKKTIQVYPSGGIKIETKQR